MSWYKNSKLWSFIGGVGAVLVGGAVVSAEATRKAVVSVMAKGMQVGQDCSEGFQSLKDDASDLAAEARMRAREQAAQDDRRAQIEERVRVQVEAEMAAEQAAADAAASLPGCTCGSDEKAAAEK